MEYASVLSSKESQLKQQLHLEKKVCSYMKKSLYINFNNKNESKTPTKQTALGGLKKQKQHYGM